MSRLLTETEARQVICPLTSILFALPKAVAGPTCLGAGCMMWRWKPRRHPDDMGPAPRMIRDQGYCGMAGEPQ
jgi:hypothetical protein